MVLKAVLTRFPNRLALLSSTAGSQGQVRRRHRMPRLPGLRAGEVAHRLAPSAVPKVLRLHYMVHTMSRLLAQDDDDRF